MVYFRFHLENFPIHSRIDAVTENVDNIDTSGIEELSDLVSNHDDNDNYTNNEKELSREFSVVGSLLNRVAFLSFLTSFWKNIFVYVYVHFFFNLEIIYSENVLRCHIRL